MYQAATGHSRNEPNGKAGKFDDVTVADDPVSAAQETKISRRSLSALLIAPIALAAGVSAPAAAQRDDTDLRAKVDQLRILSNARVEASNAYARAEEEYVRQEAAIRRQFEVGFVLKKGGRVYSWEEAMENCRRGTQTVQAKLADLKKRLKLDELAERKVGTAIAYQRALAGLLL